MKTIPKGLVIVALLSGPVAANAQTAIQSGTSALVTFRNCVAGVTACDSIGTIQSEQFGGNPGDLSASASETYANYGSAATSVALSGVDGAPILHAIASSDTGARVNTNSIALQLYTYTGAVATTDTFGGTLTYSQTLTANNYPVGAGVSASIQVFTLPTSSFNAGVTSQDNYSALFDPSTQPGYALLGSATYTDPNTNLSGTGMVGVPIKLQPGESVFVWALLLTPAPNGSVVDASDTFVTQWADSTNLTPADVAPVPLPAAAWL